MPIGIGFAGNASAAQRQYSNLFRPLHPSTSPVNTDTRVIEACALMAMALATQIKVVREIIVTCDERKQSGNHPII